MSRANLYQLEEAATMAFPLTHFHRASSTRNPRRRIRGGEGRYSPLPFSLLIVPAATLLPPSSTRNYKRSQLKRMSLNSLAPTFDYIRRIRDNRTSDNDSCHFRLPPSSSFILADPHLGIHLLHAVFSFFSNDQFVNFAQLEFGIFFVYFYI